MGYKILFIDDEVEILDMVQEYLALFDFEVVKAESYEKAKRFINDNFDLIMLDVMMEEVDGFEVCSIIRDKVDCPILFISAKDLEEDKVKALGLGGDDYITKPFGLKELKARIECHLRREKRLRSKEKKLLENGNVTIDIISKTVYCNGNPIVLTKKEYELIELLFINKGKVFSKEHLFESVWGFDSESYLDTVTEHIKNIRAKFKIYDKEKTYIQTLWGVGYKWEMNDV